MKLKLVFAAAVIAMVTTPAYAELGHSEGQDKLLKEGITAGGILTSAFPHEYELNLDSSSIVRIVSDHFPTSTSTSLRMKAQLVDEAGTIVAESSRVNGNFSIEEELGEGNYRLIVTGDSGGFGDSDVHRYSLHVAID